MIGNLYRIESLRLEQRERGERQRESSTCSRPHIFLQRYFILSSISTCFFFLLFLIFIFMVFLSEIFNGASKIPQEKWKGRGKRGKGGDTIPSILLLLRNSISKFPTRSSAVTTTAQTALFVAALVWPTAAV